ncbi:MAG TPA: Crp/Fnr family transcriptional regulator [Actinomycetota bacterium]|nr:Crp/Fnr family transcriptional regulator [Actinomycetota bacterium]
MSEALRDARWLVRNLSHHDSADLTDAALEVLGSSLERQELPRGQLLFEEGESPRGAWAIRSGRVDLSSRLGGKRSIVQILRTGAIAGDYPILLESPSLSTAHVGEEGTFLFLAARTLRSLLKTHGDLSYLWLHNVALELKDARIRILQLLGSDLPQSIARVLLNEEVDGRVELTQLAIAELLGVQRTSVNRVLMALRRSGVIRVSYGAVAITDREALSAIAVGNGAPVEETPPAERAG